MFVGNAEPKMEVEDTNRDGRRILFPCSFLFFFFFSWLGLAFGPRYLGLNVGKNKFGLQFFFFFLVGPRIGPNPLTRPAGPGRGGFGPREKNPLSKQAGSGPRVLARESGPSMEKSGLNPTRYHS